MYQDNYRHPPTTIDSQISHNKMMYHNFLQECKQEIQISVPSPNLRKYWHSNEKVHVNASNGLNLCHWSKDASIYPTVCISSTNTTLCNIFFSTTSLGSLLAYLPSTDHVHNFFARRLHMWHVIFHPIHMWLNGIKWQQYVLMWLMGGWWCIQQVIVNL